MFKEITKFFTTHSKKQILFSALNGLAALILLAFSLYLLIFLASQLNRALNEGLVKTPPPLQFDIDSFEKLNLK